MFFNTSSDLDIIPCPLLQYQYHHFTMLTFVGFFSNIGWGRCCNSVMICIFIIQQNNFILHSFNRWWVGLSWHSTSAYKIIENLVRSLQWYWWSSASYLWLFCVFSDPSHPAMHTSLYHLSCWKYHKWSILRRII